MRTNKESHKFSKSHKLLRNLTSRNLNSQAALEFLTTYAWAFLVISITIGALYYFGIFDFSRFLPQKCLFPSQFECIASTFVGGPTNEIRFRLVNNIGEEIDVNNFDVTNDEPTPLTCNPLAGFSGWLPGTEQDFTFTNCRDGGFISKERAEAKITITYCAPATTGCPPHTIKGKITAVVT